MYMASFLCNIAEYSLRLSHCHILVLYKTSEMGLQCCDRRVNKDVHTLQGTILGQINEELEDDVFLKLLTANFLTVNRECDGDNCRGE